MCNIIIFQVQIPFVISHFNHVYPLKKLEWKIGQNNLEYLMKIVLDSLNWNDFKCVIVGFVNPFCLEGFYDSYRDNLEKWMIIQSKIYLFKFYYHELMKITNV